MHGLIIDNFAGGGGASTGIEAAGYPVDYAINHCAQALAMHAANHPGTEHIREDVFAVNPRALCGRREVSLLWASPDCTFHSRAKGKKPLCRKRRGLAGVIVKWADQVRPRCIGGENVMEFLDWGPLLPNGRPDPARAGEHFRRWMGRLERLGYVVEFRKLAAADFGVRTTRKRLFFFARCDGAPIVWPETTHARRDWLAVEPCMMRDLPMGTIATRVRSDATLARIDRGRELFGYEEPFLISYYKNGGVYPLREPLRTITTKDRFALIHRDRMRMLHHRELALAQGFGADVKLPDSHTTAVELIGNSVCPPVARAIVAANMPGRAQREAVA